MREKAIEKIPYLTLPGTDPDGRVEYIGRTVWQNIGHERHIILEVYKNDRDSMQVPVVRYAATKEDWGVYYPETGHWSRKRIDSYFFGTGMCWYDEMINRHVTWGEVQEENRLYSAEDLSRIRKFFGTKIWKEERWWEYFSRNEETVKQKRTERKMERKRSRIAERDRNTPALDEERLLKWADAKIFRQRHYLYYKKRGRYADLCCSACGGVYSGAWKEGESYESGFGRSVREPREGQMGRCFLCGEYGIYKPQGKVKNAHMATEHVFLVDRYLENGAVARYIELRKEWQLEKECGAKGPEMCGACEKIEGIEVARTYYLPGKKVHTDFHKHDPYSGKDFWDDCNLYGLANIYIGEAEVYPASYRNLKGTFLQYSALKEYAAVKRRLNVNRYLERYIQFRQIEMLVKLQMYKVVEDVVSHGGGIIKNPAADRADRFLGIKKDRVRLLMEEQGDIGMLRVLQKEKEMEQNWSRQQAKCLREIGAGDKDIGTALEFMSVQKLLNNISKYAGCSYGTGCTAAEERLKAVAGTYIDYLQMRRANGYDLNNTVYQKPRNLGGAHDQMAAEQEKNKIDDRLKKVEERFPDIRRHYRKLRNRYFYEDDTFVIRPARSAEEIVMEGRKLHHCVGGNSYLEKHNKGESYILMLRFKNMQETPYITVEIRGRDGYVQQWYGMHDKKPDEENMQRWLDKYTAWLKYERFDAGNRTETDKAAQVLTAAG